MNKAEIVRKELRLIIRELGLLNYNCLNSGLTLVQAHILSYLKQNGITPFNELAIQLGIDKASLSRILNSLKTKNFIKIEKSPTDKRIKHISLLSLGMESMINGDMEANKFINEILDLGNDTVNYNIGKSLKDFRILALKNNLIKDNSRIKIEKLSSNYIEDAIKLTTEIFTYEQNIAKELIPINEDLKPIWWCARVGEDIIGVVACWQENNQWHWGRFAVDKRLRGLGIGKKMAIFSLNEMFNLDVKEVFIEARDVTVTILKQLGCEILGKPIDFYGEPVTPVIIKKRDFINKIKQQTK
ncbi:MULTISPECIES: bifunctional helix-turn-helix transcriptional regulator/GNAT family N-acetyltransferase [Clostridium]|uniref:bifunctional helix-turn-helix transcriptional regulator/GNAT family N-acetyltransferase n=1 Tax=Clostridium TaxID=1485 RepID=UPI0005EF7B64|nr:MULTISPECIES: bifunctional helix-turn-helix transcriptional regulator/GNAT family N-acetyltransferase [Clostridium]MCW6062071.1 bifunctional helix-turn-helix transcriptional regulator/GNAT family N-acetyltransferase [Clostridium sporogenes]MCW6068593.1 bifunctional helix-turn-helix transcriptional regulator/GNAT family N-acetyltransferase [Clostridium sporogenes]MDU7251730.1 bifunctional helix-turn-helix transcriptional regulator/GNAT family N-acetyltransferase [Clostridium sp.]